MTTPMPLATTLVEDTATIRGMRNIIKFSQAIDSPNFVPPEESKPMKSLTLLRPSAATLLLVLAGCAANPLNPQAQKVRLVTADPKDCEYLGEVTGNQGNFFTGGWTSNANLETGARNDLKNQAAQMGGNTVQLLTTRAGQTGSFGVGNGSGGGTSEQTNVTYVGAVYRCR